MATKPTILTHEGLLMLEQELETLKTVKRREIAEKIKAALSFGDLSENSEYDEAKNEQGLIEARIAEIERTLKNVRIVDEDELSTETINIGNRVKIKDIEMNEVLEMRIVGSKEVDPEQNKISDESPIGRALIGGKVGDIVQVAAPMGSIDFEIMEITK
mgnify:CR=1 FL=1